MNAKRGYVPEDDRNFSKESLTKMRTASRHVLYLINEGYDLKQATTFVGNHFILSERQRLAIARSVSVEEQLNARKNKEKESAEGSEVWIDGFNAIITAEVLLSDSILFEGMDGTIRDLAALRGTYKIIPETRAAAEMIFDELSEMKVSAVHILLDEPVSNSGRLKTLLAEIGEKYNLKLDIQIIREVDRELYKKENVITADAIILDNCISWINLMKRIIKRHEINILRVW
ncbi:MAG: DUF434 domain-containing protein [Lachnospiraceae bacterium]|nr:DUF434 domain-containing protein [Lachnospiraceae bacterium]